MNRYPLAFLLLPLLFVFQVAGESQKIAGYPKAVRLVKLFAIILMAVELLLCSMPLKLRTFFLITRAPMKKFLRKAAYIAGMTNPVSVGSYLISGIFLYLMFCKEAWIFIIPVIGCAWGGFMLSFMGGDGISNEDG